MPLQRSGIVYQVKETDVYVAYSGAAKPCDKERQRDQLVATAFMSNTSEYCAAYG